MLSKVKKSIFLIGHTDTAIRGSKLPSRLQVLRYFFYRVHELSETIHETKVEVAKSVIGFWQKARIPTKKDCHVNKQILDLYKEWRSLQKSASRRSELQISRERAFVETLPDLFDIAHENALTDIKI